MTIIRSLILLLLRWPNYGPNRLGRSVYGPYPSFWFSRGVSVSVLAAAGWLLWWEGVLGVS